MNKKLLPLILFLSFALFQSCTGPEGPQGPPGNSGNAPIGQTFDLTKVNFTSANNFQFGLTFADADLSQEVLESDAVLVYIHWGTQQVGNETLDTWRLLPQTAFVDNNGNFVIYNFDRTKKDFSVFLDATVDLTKLASDWTQNQTFRVVIVPSDFAARKSGSIDYKDYNAVKELLHLDESKIRKIKVN